MKTPDPTPRMKPVARSFLALMLFAFFAGSPTYAAFEEEYDPGMRLTQRDWVNAQHAEQSSAYADHEDVLILPGLLANRTERTVTLYAEATGLVSSEPAEFFLISDTSGHDYEAMAVSYARPSHVHQALEFIGLEPGAPFNPRELRFSPKGERVLVRVAWEEDDVAHNWAAEEMMIDTRTNDHLLIEGFVFVGSIKVPDENGDLVYAADHAGPRSIISDYNEPTTVLDVPRRVDQGDIYGYLRPHPERIPERNRLLHITFTPEYTDGRQRVVDCALHILPGEEDAPIALRLVDGDGEALHEGVALHNVLAAFHRLRDAGRTPYVQFEPDADLSLVSLQSFYEQFDPLITQADIPVEPPPEGALFFRAFLPIPSHRDRAQRPTQALEWQVQRTDDGITGEVVDVKDLRERREDDPVFSETRYPASTPEALRAALDEAAHRFPVLLVFAPGDWTYGELMTYLDVVLTTHRTIYLFLE